MRLVRGADGRAVDVAGRVHAAAQLDQLLLQDGDGDAGGGLHRGEDLALREGIEPRKGQPAKQVGKRLRVRRTGEAGGGGEEFLHCGGRRHRGSRVRLRASRLLVVGGGRPAPQGVVEVLAMQRRDDVRGDVREVQPVRQRGRGLPAGVPGIGEDGDVGGAPRPLPAP